MGEDMKNNDPPTAEMIEAGWETLEQYKGDNRAVLVSLIYMAMKEAEGGG